MNKLLELYRYLRCYLSIRISGGFPERFLNLCSREGIYLWDTLYENGGVTAKIYCSDFIRLRKIRAKSGVKIKIIKKSGLKYWLKENSRHKALIYGFIFSLLLMSIMNLFVWCIDTQGSETISRYELLSAFDGLGLSFGTFVPLFDENEANREAVNYFDGKVLWAAANIKGSKATLEVRERITDENDEPEENGPCNIIADFDGIIVSAEVYSGVSKVLQGSTVKSGDLLISGISENSDGSVNFHSADGRITAYSKRKASAVNEKEKSFVRLQKIKRDLTVDAFSLSIPLSPFIFTENNTAFEYTELINIDNSILPFGYTVKASAEETTETAIIDGILFSVDEFTEEEYSSMKNTLILDSEYNFSAEGDSLYITAEYDCIDFIGKKSVIFQEN